ncbi:unnamed protein product [Schistosoma curassoni]|uniref:Uncharacterized protein n=1 Tax=Schistosoma curassoni TaxID=6186 RepID=A0A183JM82_9TREM|nr:unnamed protein product [Schistosoma curassoni]
MNVNTIIINKHFPFPSIQLCDFLLYFSISLSFHSFHFLFHLIQLSICFFQQLTD